MAAVRAKTFDEIDAHFGSYAEWEGIGDWSTFTPPQPERTPAFLDHGYDESKHPSEWTSLDYVEAATFRGGELLTVSAVPGGIRTPLVWRCAFDHVFAASPLLVLHGGHWCPDCVRDSAGYAQQAERNRFLAQIEFARTPATRLIDA